MAIRGEFSSRIGFVLAAAGSAVGLGNIWGFPTKVASNGGAAFVLVYLLLAFVLAYPVLMAELIIGRSSRSNMVDALGKISGNFVGRLTGIWGCVTVSLILAFYAIVGGWMLVYFADAAVSMVGFTSASDWLLTSSVTRNIIFCFLFMGLTAFIVVGGVKSGIEKWSVRLMPTLVILILALIVYVSLQPGAVEGWSAYLVPDFSRVALVDIGVAVIAGMLIIPAMYVALNNGVEIFTPEGALIQGDTLIFKVLPALFDTIGSVGLFVAFTFFALMAIAAVTSSISMLEVPVAFMVESKGLQRKKAVLLMASVIFVLSCIIILNFETLFGFVIALTTEYSQPLLGLALCIFAGWVWRRDAILDELKQGDQFAEHSIFWKIWPWYVRFVCPVIIALMFYRSVF
jgi:NSS family neurotransmitter:Na+ symporter